ncbi:uncharacterized protein M6B38_376805 [Iris pallida]|uniref:Uncharacterized protein n=1 Tax=Iris pallida TaxID=29817 RepID=A0AAX6GA60_IRIPA|nr:uncharacterized protein M6B38_376805 [Iris pallida]
MAKSLRSKRKKRLRTLRREIAEPFYDKKESAKLKAQEAALNAPKLPVRVPRNNRIDAIEEDPSPSAPAIAMDVEMADAGKSKSLLKPVGGVGKKQLKKKLKLKKDKRKGKGKGKLRRSNI